MTFPIASCACVVALVTSSLQARTPAVVIDIAPAKIERRTFDPANPPAEMPTLVPPEVGTCVYQFGCVTEAQAEGSRVRTARVTQIELRATLTVTLWTPVNGPAKILAHEEAHREICEYYYDNARRVGRQLAERAIGTALRAKTRVDMEAELDLLQKQLIRRFLNETATRCDVAQARFDAITQHSMNSIAEEIAITRAIAAEEASYAQRGLNASPVPGSESAAAAARRYPPTRPKQGT